jgi:hypothetical protein
VKNESKSLSFGEGFRVRLKSFTNKTPPISRGQ